MPSYVYKARDAAGKSVKGTMEARSKEELADKLHRMGYATTQAAEALPGISLDFLLEPFRGIGAEDRVIFNVQLANLLSAGIPLLAALNGLTHQIENRRLRETVASVARNVEAGETFSEALSRYPKIFPGLFVSLVKAGEASGKLDTILTRYAAYSEEQAELEQKIKGALFYPLLLLAAGLAVTLFIVTFIIPQFAEIFTKSGIRLPLPTVILYQIGVTIKHFWHTMILGALALWVAVTFYAGTAPGRLQMDALKLKFPLVGPLYRKAAVSRFGRTLGMLVAAGVPILESLDIVQDVIGNEVLGRVLANVRSAVEKGEKISEPLRVSGEFPPDTVQMIAVGEETGNLDDMLGKIADFYDRSVGYSVKKLTTVLEPLLLVLMGCLVGFIMASMLLPMFDMMKMLRTARAGF